MQKQMSLEIWPPTTISVNVPSVFRQNIETKGTSGDFKQKTQKIHIFSTNYPLHKTDPYL
jgi:hypothetical protein